MSAFASESINLDRVNNGLLKSVKTYNDGENKVTEGILNFEDNALRSYSAVKSDNSPTRFKSVESKDGIRITLENDLVKQELVTKKDSDLFYVTTNGVTKEYDRRDYEISSQPSITRSSSMTAGAPQIPDNYSNVLQYSRYMDYYGNGQKLCKVYESHNWRYSSSKTYRAEAGEGLLVVAGLFGLGVSTLASIIGSAATLLGGTWYVASNVTFDKKGIESSFHKRVTVSGSDYYYSGKKIKYEAYFVDNRETAFREIDRVEDYNYGNNYYLCTKAINAFWEINN